MKTSNPFLGLVIGCGGRMLLVLCLASVINPVHAQDAEVQVELSGLGVRFDRSAELAERLEASPSPAVREPYRLGIGDILGISVYGQAESYREVSIDPNGDIHYLLVGSVPAAGRTIDELRNDLGERFKRHLRFPLVSVVPLEFGSQSLTILGQVSYPRTYLLEGNLRLADLIALAGGLRMGEFRNSTVELADLEHAVLLRDGEALPVDFHALLKLGAAEHNVLLKSGDLVVIPSSLMKNVFILGEVNFPRSYGFIDRITVLQLLAEGRGLGPRAGRKILVVRGALAQPEVFELNLDRVLSGRDPNMHLRPGDIVYVPERRFELLKDALEAAVLAFGSSAAAEAATQVYEEVAPDSDLPERPIVVPGAPVPAPSVF